ncbi:MAG: MFS transporter [Lactobacillus delbrueckii]|jgi:predicted MFS family arabinose efflux permease|nr:MFS transporter [Lactobacillus delbrueckii]MCI1929089.1 MFS transporter [Lactobacillus delbrueckii]MCI1949133.1 MFS transporter [Lactobacillus delbrueckii]
MSRYKIQAFLFVFVAFMLGCNEYMIVGVLPDISREINASLSSLGYLVTVFALVYAIATPIVTSLTKYFKRHQLLFFLMGIFFIGNTWTALSHSYISLLLSRILSATTAGAIISLILVIANFVAPLEKRASLLSWIFAGFSIASIIGLPIGTFISTTFSWHASFWMISLLTLVTFALLLIFVPRDTPQSQSSKGNKQFAILGNRQIQLTLLAIILACAAQYTYYTYIRSLITDYMHFPKSWLNVLLLLLGLAFIAGNKTGGFLADHGGIKRLPLVFGIQTILLFLLAPLLPLSWLAFLCIVGICCTNSMYGSSTQVYFLDLAAAEYPESIDFASSFNSIFANIGISLGSFTAAQAAGLTGISSTPYFGGVYSLLSCLLMVLVCRQLAAKK